VPGRECPPVARIHHPLSGGDPPDQFPSADPGGRSRIRGQRPSRVGRAVSDEPGGVRVRIAHGSSATELAVGYLINCSGAGTNIAATADPLVRQFLDSGLARPDPLRMGLDADARGALRDASGATTCEE
jgi:uncharacterized NAD(P)/FAD-binding protein YdhS